MAASARERKEQRHYPEQQYPDPVPWHTELYFRRRQPHRQQMIQFGIGSFRGHVKAADHTSLGERCADRVAG